MKIEIDKNAISFYFSVNDACMEKYFRFNYNISN